MENTQPWRARRYLCLLGILVGVSGCSLDLTRADDSPSTDLPAEAATLSAGEAYAGPTDAGDPGPQQRAVLTPHQRRAVGEPVADELDAVVAQHPLALVGDRVGETDRVVEAGQMGDPAKCVPQRGRPVLASTFLE